MFSEAAATALAPVQSLGQEASACARPLNLKITGLKTFVVNACRIAVEGCRNSQDIHRKQKGHPILDGLFAID